MPDNPDCVACHGTGVFQGAGMCHRCLGSGKGVANSYDAGACAGGKQCTLTVDFKTRQATFMFCPLHAAAPKLYAALKFTRSLPADPSDMQRAMADEMADAALLEAIPAPSAPPSKRPACPNCKDYPDGTELKCTACGRYCTIDLSMISAPDRRCPHGHRHENCAACRQNPRPTDQ